jgi:hypothetical protein
VEVEEGARAGTAIDIQLVLYVLDPTVIVVTPSVERIPLSDDVALRPLGSDRSAGPSGPAVLTLAVDFPDALPVASVAEPLWAYLRSRRGGRGVVTARLVRHREGRGERERHELWFAIPLRSGRAARRQIDAFFEEVLRPSLD